MTDRASVSAELLEIKVLVESTRAEVARAKAKEEEAAGRLVDASQKGSLPAQALAAAESHAQALERRAAMAIELASLEAKAAVLERLVSVLDDGRPAAAPAPAAEDALDETRLLRAVMATQEEERRRIARAVHDGPAQAMANVVLQSEISERVFQNGDALGAKAELASLRAMVHKTLQELRGFIFELRPMILDDLGLVPTLRRYVQTIAEKHGVKIDLSSTGRDRRLPANDEVAMFRLVQDALVERVQGAGAKELAVALDWRDEALEIRVQSDGAESAPAPEASGLTRAERLGLLGGSSQAGRAGDRTVLTLHLPIARPPQMIS